MKQEQRKIDNSIMRNKSTQHLTNQQCLY